MTLKSFLNHDSIHFNTIPWGEKKFSRRSLALHLDQSTDVNSRRQFIIKKQINWLHHFILKQQCVNILDLACGPGLYLAELSKFGHNCTGIDISPAAIDYAKAHFSNIHFLCQDIMTATLEEKFDVILLNFGWFHNFQKPVAKKLLKQITAHLSSGGKVVLELIHSKKIKDYGEAPPCWHRTKSGIFSDSPYLFLQENNWSERNKLAELHYHILQPNRPIRSYKQIYQAYQDQELIQLLEQFNLKEFHFFSDISDQDEFDEDLYFLVCTG